MTKEEILENNKLIAHFIGYKPFDNGDKRYSSNDWYCGENIVYAQYKDLGYDKSWDWLMEVIKKCLDKNTEDLEDWQYHYECINDSLFQVEIKQTYQEIIKFIKWYNNEQINKN